MSDSDDTDILLLIPPDYYLANAEEKLIAEDLESLKRKQLKSIQENKRRLKIARDLTSNFQAMDLENSKEEESLSVPPPPTSNAYQFLAPSRKAELNNINTKLHYLEREEMAYIDNPSDISSISANTIKTQFGPSKHNREQVGMVHSTPKCMDTSFKQPIASKKSNIVQECKDDGVLLEIDNFLSNDRVSANSGDYWQQRHSDEYSAKVQQRLPNMEYQYQSHGNNMRTSIHTGSADKVQTSDNHMSKTENNLISLSEIWGKSGQSTAIATSSQSNLKEEQLRRQHLEKTVRQLQSRLLEYQQRLSVAIEVDRTKDNALNNVQMENKSLSQELQQIQQNLQSYEQQRKQYDEKMEALQKELAQAVSLATKFQEKNERMEMELTNYTRKSNESSTHYKQKMEELEIQVHACKRSEEMSLNELQKLRDKYAKSEHLYEKIKLKCEELEKENSTLRHQKEMLHEYHQKQKSRADNLENQRKSLQESLAHLTENECTLRKKLDVQQKSLKCHYQQQLENVVSQKLKEFQEQLDRTEENLRTEARERERLIAERAVKQFELINEKNELELKLLQEKQKEEVELYRIQLANATKKIEDLELKLSLYKSKRADIAEKLHNVMETQWQKALEILTSPNLTRLTQLETTDNESPDGNETHNNALLQQQNHQNHYETPKTSKKENNLNLPKNTSPPVDKLQAYIELLLSKSPSDFDKLNEILSLTSKTKQSKEKLDKNAKRYCQSRQPPWKS